MIVLFVVFSCLSMVPCYREETGTIKIEGINYIVDSYCDLEGNSLFLPPGSILTIKPQCKVVNGVIEGNKTSLVTEDTNSIGVRLSGTWIAPDISDEVFDSNYLSDNEIMSCINCLMSDDIHNLVTLNKDYVIDITEDSGCGLDVKSDSEVRINGSISLNPNRLIHYNIISVKGRSGVQINGGEIVGDVGRHNYVNGSSSEWGMGIYVYGSQDVIISGVNVSKCTGDGIYIGGRTESDLDIYTHASRNIVLEDIVSDNNRRQGMSITHAQNVIVKDCVFSNTGRIERTAPASGVDIEPNKNQSVRDVSLIGCIFKNNYNYSFISGATYRVKPGRADTYNVSVKNCIMDGTVYICNGGIVLDNCSIDYLKLRDTDMPKGIIEVKNCSLFQGLFLGYSKLKERIDSDARIVFDNCQISRDKKDAPYPGSLIDVSVKDDVRTSVSFYRCRLSLSSNLDYNLFSNSSLLDCSFSGCSFSLPGIELQTNGASFNDCSIDCSHIGIRSRAGRCDSFVKCKIRTTDKNRVFLIYDNKGDDGGYDFEVLHCNVNDTKAKVFETKTNKRVNLKCRVIGNSFKSSELAPLLSKYQSVEQL